MKTQYFFQSYSNRLCLGISKKFQGLGIMVSTDNPGPYSVSILVELKLFWTYMYYSYIGKKYESRNS